MTWRLGVHVLFVVLLLLNAWMERNEPGEDSCDCGGTL